MASFRLACLIIVLADCDAGQTLVQAPPLEVGTLLQPDFVTDREPTASEVASFVSRGYQRPRLVKVTREKSDSPLDASVRRWTETYNGIPVLDDIVSAHMGNWHTRFHGRLHEPELPDRRTLLPESAARSKADVPASTPSRLVYEPRWAQRKLPDGSGANAADYVLAIEGYDLAYELDTADELVQVDAYAGTVTRTSHWVE